MSSPFSAEDLKRLKERAHQFCLDTDVASDEVNVRTLRALIARLEAAEAVAGHRHDNCTRFQGSCVDEQKLYEAWLRSKGEAK